MHSIILGGENAANDNQELEWSDDEDDPQVENLLNMIEQGYPFTHSTFTGLLGCVKIQKPNPLIERLVKQRMAPPPKYLLLLT